MGEIWRVEFACAGFQLGDLHVPPFEVPSHSLAFVRFPGRASDVMIPKLVRILAGAEPHAAVDITGSGAIAYHHGMPGWPGVTVPRRGTLESWIRTELRRSPRLIPSVLDGADPSSPFYPEREVASTGSGTQTLVSLRLLLVHHGIVLYCTSGSDPWNKNACRESVTRGFGGKLWGGAIELHTEDQPLDDAVFPEAPRIFIVKSGSGPRPG